MRAPQGAKGDLVCGQGTPKGSQGMPKEDQDMPRVGQGMPRWLVKGAQVVPKDPKRTWPWSKYKI